MVLGILVVIILVFAFLLFLNIGPAVRKIIFYALITIGLLPILYVLWILIIRILGFNTE